MLLFLESFDAVDEATADVKWDAGINTGSARTIETTGGRNGGGCCLMTGQQSVAYLRKNIPGSSTVVTGHAFRVNSLGNDALAIVAYFEAASNHVGWNVTATGAIQVVRNNTTVLGTSSAGVIAVDTWYYVEFKASISDSVGTYEVRVNGVSVLSGSSADTRTSGANGRIEGIQISGVTSKQYRFDDLYILDTTGSVNNDFLGDLRVSARLPNGNGTASQFTGSDGNSTDNYALVDESPHNSGTDYVGSSTAAQKDTYAVANLPYTPITVFGVQVTAVATKSLAGLRNAAVIARSSGVETLGASRAVQSSYKGISHCYDVDDGQGSPTTAWSKTLVDAAEFGVQVTV